MKIEGYLSFYSATLNGIESTKKSLVLFDSLIIPGTESAIGKQVEVFSGKHQYVKNYLSNHIMPLERLDSNYSAIIREMMNYFGKHHYDNWLKAKFEEEIGEFATSAEAELSWNLSLRLDSILLSQIVARDRKVPSYCDDSEVSCLRNPPESFERVISNITIDEIFDRVIPDPSRLDWNDLVDMLETPEFVSFRERLWSSIQSRTSLSEEYIKALEEFFKTNYPDNLQQTISLNVVETFAGLLIPVTGPAKSLYKIAKDLRDYKKFAWVSVICKMRKKLYPENNS